MVARIQSPARNGRKAEHGPIEVLRDVKEQLTDMAAELRRGAVAAKKGLKQQLSEAMRVLSETVMEEAEGLFQKQRGSGLARTEVFAGKEAR